MPVSESNLGSFLKMTKKADSRVNISSYNSFTTSLSQMLPDKNDFSKLFLDFIIFHLFF